MKATILGSGTCVPSRLRASPCVLVQVAGSAVVCDTGPGSLRQLLKAGITVGSVDVLIYSHFHIDHTADFCPFLFAAKYGRGAERSRGITVMGPPGLLQWYDNLKRVYGQWIVPERFAITWIETGLGEHAFDGFTVQTVPVLHSGSSNAVRINEAGGASLAYSGDTDYCEGIVAATRDAAKAILECSCPEGHKAEGHLTPSLAGLIARESNCAGVVLTHIYPEADRTDLLAPVRRHYGGPVAIAHDMMSFTL